MSFTRITAKKRGFPDISGTFGRGLVVTHRPR